MSYYMGDYYAGDPGIGSFFKKALGFGASLIPGVGGLASKMLGKVLPGGKAAAAITAASQATSQAIVRHPALSVAGAAGALATSGMMGMGVARMGSRAGAGMAIAGPLTGPARMPITPRYAPPGTKGYHPKKLGRGLVASDIWVRNRRMNPFNPRAARRASRRLHSLVRAYRKYIGFVSAKRPKGRPYIKRAKKSR
jgi:hypothetical protein